MISKTRILFSIIGILFLSLGLNLLLSCNFGVSSFDTVTLLISNHFSIEFAKAALYLHGFFVVLLLVYWLFKKVKFSEIVVSCISIFLITRCISALSIFANITYQQESVKIIIFIVGYALFCLGAVFTMKSNFLIAPVDKFIVQTGIIFKTNPGYLRVCVDTSLLIIALVWSSYNSSEISVSLFTVLITFGTGFIIKYLYPMFRGMR